MDKESLRIVFMGTPEFAVESLKSLVENGYQVVGVVTMPDKPIGRHGHTLSASPVKQYAVAQGIPVLQPEKLKSPDFVDALKALRADLQIVVAFRMLPEVVWAMPRLGTFNLHASLLPQYRGAAPINWAIINGEKETGITTFFLDKEIDTGRIIRQERVPIAETDNAGDVHDRLMTRGARLVLATVDDILRDAVRPLPQCEMLHGAETLRPAPKIFRETCQIDWSQSPRRICDFVRGLSPYPGAWTTIVDAEGQPVGTLKIFAATMESDTSPFALPIRPTEVQLAGKRRMSFPDFLRGFNYQKGMKLR